MAIKSVAFIIDVEIWSYLLENKIYHYQKNCLITMLGRVGQITY